MTAQEIERKRFARKRLFIIFFVALFWLFDGVVVAGLAIYENNALFTGFMVIVGLVFAGLVTWLFRNAIQFIRAQGAFG